MCRKISLIAFLLLAAAPAHAAMPLYKCTPDDFQLVRTRQGFYLQGQVNVSQPGYTYTTTPMTSDGRGGGEGTLTFHAPPKNEAMKDPFTPLAVKAEFPAVYPLAKVTFKFETDTGPSIGPASVDCLQIGGVQY